MMTEQTFLMRIDETRIPEWEADNILQNLSITANELLQGLNHVDADRSLKISPSALRALTGWLNDEEANSENLDAAGRCRPQFGKGVSRRYVGGHRRGSIQGNRVARLHHGNSTRDAARGWWGSYSHQW